MYIIPMAFNSNIVGNLCNFVCICGQRVSGGGLGEKVKGYGQFSCVWSYAVLPLRGLQGSAHACVASLCFY